MLTPSHMHTHSEKKGNKLDDEERNTAHPFTSTNPSRKHIWWLGGACITPSAEKNNIHLQIRCHCSHSFREAIQAIHDLWAVAPFSLWPGSGADPHWVVYMDHGTF